MPIYKAIIKHGYANFKLEILEYCDPKILLLREQYYIDLLKSDYNVLNTTGSTFGYKHTEATLTKFNLRKVSSNTRANLAKAALARVLSEETKINISVAKIGVKLSEETKAKLSDVGAKIRGVSVEIVNTITGEIKQYLTLTSAGLALGVSRTAIKKAIISGKIIKKTYIVKLMSRK
jgi:group I intron endonuclease